MENVKKSVTRGKSVSVIENGAHGSGCMLILMTVLTAISELRGCVADGRHAAQQHHCASHHVVPWQRE